MSLFPKKRYPSLSEIIKGIQEAVNSAQDMLHAQQIRNLSCFLSDTNGEPATRKVKIEGREIEVPLISLLPHSHLAMEDVEVKFNAKVADVAEAVLTGLRGADLSHTDLHMALDGVKAEAGDTMQFTLRFRQQPVTEGVARLIDEFNKEI